MIKPEITIVPMHLLLTWSTTSPNTAATQEVCRNVSKPAKQCSHSHPVLIYPTLSLSHSFEPSHNPANRTEESALTKTETSKGCCPETPVHPTPSHPLPLHHHISS